MSVVSEVDRAAFERFVADTEPALRRALVALRGPEDGREATAEALLWAWQHWDRVETMQNPAGYLFRVGQSRSRRRRFGLLPVASDEGMGDVEPGLGAALAALSLQQRTAVVLVHGCGWSYSEVAEALGVSKSSVGTHVARGLAALRAALEVQDA